MPPDPSGVDPSILTHTAAPPSSLLIAIPAKKQHDKLFSCTLPYYLTDLLSLPVIRAMNDARTSHSYFKEALVANGLGYGETALASITGPWGERKTRGDAER